MTSSYTGTPSDWETPENLDPYDLLFDEDKARKAASAVKIFQDVSVGSTKEKMKEEGNRYLTDGEYTMEEINKLTSIWYR
jgi:hypothetical protein